MSNKPFKSSSHISTSSEWKSEITTVNNVDVRVYEPVDTSTPVIITAPQFSVGGDPTFSVNKIKRTVDEILLDNIHAPVTCQALLSCTASGEIVQTHSSGYHLLPVSGQKIYEYLSTNTTSGGGGGGSSYITADTYAPPTGFPTAGYKISDNLRLDSADLTVEGALNITGTIGAAGSKTATYGYSSFNHAGAAAVGYGRTNVSVGNTILCAADSLVSIESDDRINVNAAKQIEFNVNESIYVNIGKPDGSSPVPAAGHFRYNMDIGGYNSGLQQPGSYMVTAGSTIDLYSPVIRIGSANWNNVNYTTHVYTYAQTITQMNAPNHYRYGNFMVYNGYLQVFGPAYASFFQTTSDDRLKHNEEDLTDCLNVIRKLKPQKYQKTTEMKAADFNGQLNEGEYTIEAGFIAQDVKKDIPELNFCVTDPNKDNEPYHLDYNSIFTTHIAATKELDSIVTGLLAEITSLKERLSVLEN